MGGGLQRELEELERRDPAVGAAAKRLEEVTRSIGSKPVPAEEVRDADLRVGDMVDVLGWKRIVAIDPYTGPHAFVIGVARTVPGGSFSLTDTGYTKRAR